MSMTVGVEHLFNAAIEAVRRGMNIAFHPPVEPNVHARANRNDLVTAVGKAIEAGTVPHLHVVISPPPLGEEGHTVSSFAGLVWIPDPIDGMMNCMETYRDHAVSLALCEDGTPILGAVADVVAGRIHHAIRGQGAWVDRMPLTQVTDVSTYRDAIIITNIKEVLALPWLAHALQDNRGHRRYGSAVLECVEVAVGRVGTFIHMWVSLWDIAAATLIVTECGVLATHLDGTPLNVRYKGSIFFGTPNVHATLVECLTPLVQ